MKKRILMCLFLILHIILIGCGTENLGSSNSVIQNNESNNITIQRIDHSVINDDGRILAEIYFDKPVICESSEEALKANNFFQNQYENWVNGIPDKLSKYTANNAMDFFIESLNKFRYEHKDKEIPEDYFKCYVDTEIIYQSVSILSVRQKVYWNLTGSGSFYILGTTIDLKTGELLPFTALYDVDADMFRNDLINFLITATHSWTDANRLKKGIMETYGSNSNHNFDYVCNEQVCDLSNDYYYDGQQIYLTLDLGVYNGTDVIIKWNGKVDSEFDAELWRYSNIKNDFKEYQEFPIVIGTLK